MIGKIVRHVKHAAKHAVKGPRLELSGPGKISRALAEVHADAEVQALARSYTKDPTAETGTRLRHRAMSVVMKSTKGQMNPAIVASVIREEFPHVW